MLCRRSAAEPLGQRILIRSGGDGLEGPYAELPDGPGAQFGGQPAGGGHRAAQPTRAQRGPSGQKVPGPGWGVAVVSDLAGMVPTMRFGEQCQAMSCTQRGATAVPVGDGERRWDFLLCAEHEDQVEAGDQTHVLRSGGRPVLVVGSMLVSGGGG